MRKLKALGVIKLNGMVELTTKQARRRLTMLEGELPKPKNDKDDVEEKFAEYITKGVITLKVGEVFGYDDVLPKSLYPILEDVETKQTLFELHQKEKAMAKAKVVKASEEKGSKEGKA